MDQRRSVGFLRRRGRSRANGRTGRAALLSVLLVKLVLLPIACLCSTAHAAAHDARSSEACHETAQGGAPAPHESTPPHDGGEPCGHCPASLVARGVEPTSSAPVVMALGELLSQPTAWLTAPGPTSARLVTRSAHPPGWSVDALSCVLRL